MPADMEGLRKPFPPELIGKLPGSAKRPALDYVGHAAVTDRLLQCAPDYEFEVLNTTGSAQLVWVLARMTIDGVSRDEYGEGDDQKKALSDAFKRCAMRWGVALDLWSKEDLGFGGPSTEGGGGTSADPIPPISSAREGTGKDPSEGAAAEGEPVSPGGEGAGSSEAIHIHEFTDHFTDGKPTRPGWLVCACGVAEQESKVK